MNELRERLNRVREVGAFTRSGRRANPRYIHDQTEARPKLVDGGSRNDEEPRYLKWKELDLDKLTRENPLASVDYRETEAHAVIEIDDVVHIKPEIRERIAAQVHRYGFARVKIRAEKYDEKTILSLFHGLDLGEPYVPPYFESHGIESQSGVNRVTAPSHPASDATPHNAFKTTNASGFHVDGVFYPFTVKTSINMLSTRAKEGGDSLLFNTTAAFLALARTDPEAAEALMLDDALETRSETNPNEIHAMGPIIRVRTDGTIEARLLMDVTAEWEKAIERNPAIGRAYAFFRSLMYEGSPYYMQFGLEEGEALVINNTGISHGRTAYTDDPEHPRLLYRVLSETAIH